MRKVVKLSKTNPGIRELALKLTRHLPQKAWVAEVSAIHAFVRDQIRYIKDIRGCETIQFPVITLELGQGDCDDKTMLTAALLESIGHPTRLVAVGMVPGLCQHVLLETRVGRKWIPVETTEPVALGWYPPGVKTRIVRHI